MIVRPFSIALLCLVLLYLATHAVVPFVSPIAGVGRWLALFAVTGIGLWLAALQEPSHARQLPRGYTPYSDVRMVVGVLLTVYLITALAGGLPLLSLLKWVGLLCQVLLVLYIMPRIFEPHDWRLLLLGVLGMASGVTLLALMAGITGIQVSYWPVWHQGRLAAVSNPNTLATVTIITALGALWEAHRPYFNWPWYKALLLGIAGGAVVALYWTGSRSSLVGFAMGVGVWLLATGRVRILLGLGVLALIPLSQMTFIQEFIQVAQGRYRIDQLFATRDGVWETALNNWREQPYFGHGFGITGGDFELTSWTSAIGSVVDGSGYFGVLASVGIVGVAVLLALYARVALTVVRLSRLAVREPEVRTRHLGWWIAMYGGSVFAALTVQAVGEPWLIAPGAYEHLMLWLCVGMMYVGGTYLGVSPMRARVSQRQRRERIRNV